MNLPQLSIRRHVLAFMLSGVLVLFGLISYQRIGIDRFPHIEFPIVSVTTLLPGASPESVDSSITNVIETSINAIPGIDDVHSTSSPGVSNVIITFDLDKNIDVAFNEVQAKINQILRLLPDDADPPVVAKVETGAQPIMWLAVQGDRTQQQLNQYARNVIKKRLETIDGVGEVRLGGRRDRTIRIELDTARMNAYSVRAQEVVEALRREHIQLPGGFVVGQRTEALIKLDFEFHDLNSMRDLVIAYRGSAPIKLKDVAQVRDDLADYRQLARFNGKPSVGVGIVKIPNSNTVAIVDAVKQRLDEEIIPALPPGITIKIASNDALFIQEIVDTLKEHLVEGTLLAALIVLIFLKSLRSTAIIAISIPVSLLGAVAVMHFAGFTFNALTLLALLLLIGVVVDDSIVVLENIYRHQEIDRDPVRAAENGSAEVVFAVIAASLALVSIFAPVIFMGGIIGKFFQSFAVVVTFGVLVSLFVSLTLTPMLCARYLRVPERHGRLYQRFEEAFQATDRWYRRMLDRALQHRWKVIVLTVIVVASSAIFFSLVDKAFTPEEDEGRFLVTFKTPLGSNIEYTNDRLKRIEAVLARHREIATYFTAIGLGQAAQVNQGIAFVRLTPRDERDLSQSELIAKLRGELSQIPGVQAFAAPVPIVGGLRGEPLQFVLNGPNLQELGRLAPALQDRLSATPGIGRLDVDLQLNLPQYELVVDRVRAAQYGLSAQDIATAISATVGGLDIGKYNDANDGERYDVRIKAGEGQFTQLRDLAKIYLRARDGSSVRLDAIATFRSSLGPAVISRYDLRYAANFFGSPTIPLGEAIKVVEDAAANLPPGYGIRMLGQAEEFAKTTSNLSFAALLALSLLYMVLASQFNSFIQPLVIMLAQPLAIIGGVLALWLTGNSLNIYSMIGLVLLIGLVAKNSILLVDLTNQLRAQGRDIDTALREACPIRMRPVVMTSLTIILALSPAALGFGAGAATNGPLAVAVIGGMITSTLLTLVVVPAVYSLLEHRLERTRARRRAA